MRNRMLMLFCGTVFGLTTLSIAMGAVPSRVTDDTAIYQSLSEIKAPREAHINFDADIQHLSSLESRYREKLPSVASDPRLSGPMKRISAQKYRMTPVKKSVSQN